MDKFYKCYFYFLTENTCGQVLQVLQVLFLLFNREHHKTNKTKETTNRGKEHLQVGTNVRIVIRIIICFRTFYYYYLCVADYRSNY